MSLAIASLIAALVAIASQPRKSPTNTAWPVPKRTSRTRAISPFARPEAREATSWARSGHAILRHVWASVRTGLWTRPLRAAPPVTDDTVGEAGETR